MQEKEMTLMPPSLSQKGATVPKMKMEDLCSKFLKLICPQNYFYLSMTLALTPPWSFTKTDFQNNKHHLLVLQGAGEEPGWG